MRFRSGALVAALALVAPTLVFVASPAVARVPSEDDVVTVQVRDNVFRPSNLAVKPGTVVRWVNEGRNRHNVTPNSGRAFGSRNLAPGQSYAFRFADAGDFAYYCTLHGAPGKGQHANLVVGDDVGASEVAPVGGSDAPTPTIAASGRTIRVPADAKTVQAGVDPRAPGRPRPRVTGRLSRGSRRSRRRASCCAGSNRNTTILDGDFKRDNGVKVLGADGVAIENLTIRNYTDNGLFWNGVLGYRASYVTAYRNGYYGIFAFDSQWGMFDHSYASGSPDSGFYIGQCDPCHAVITDVTAEYNQLGYSGTNAGGDLFIVRSVWRNNRSGIIPNSLSSEELAPQGNAVIAGNLVEKNGSADAARGDEIWDVVYGVGIGIVGGSDNQIIRNHVPGERGHGHRDRAQSRSRREPELSRDRQRRAGQQHPRSEPGRPRHRARRTGRPQLFRRQRVRHVGAGRHRAGDALRRSRHRRPEQRRDPRRPFPRHLEQSGRA